MASTTVDELVVKIKADVGQLNKQLSQIQSKSGTVGKQAGSNLATMGAGAAGASMGLSKMLTPLLSVGAVFAGARLAGEIATVGSRFEDLQDSLTLVFGGEQNAQQAFKEIKTFAQTTPFQIDDVTKAFIGLKSAGIEPTTDMLQTFADTASVATDTKGTFEALITFFQRSAAGGASLVELNRINDRGIDIFGRLEKEIGKSRTELSEFGQTAEGSKVIQEALLKVLKRDFGGAMALKMDNLSTMTSNMTIAFKDLADEVFKSGLGDLLKGITTHLTNMAMAIGKLLRQLRGDQTVEDFLGSTTVDLGPEPVHIGNIGRTRENREREMTLEEIRTALILKRDENQANIDLLASTRAHTREGVIGNIEMTRGFQRNIFNLDRLIKLKDKEILAQKFSNKTTKEFTSLSVEQVEIRQKLQSILEKSVPEIEKLNKLLKEVDQFSGLKNKDGELLFTDADLEQIRAYIGELIVLEEEGENTVGGIEQMQQAIQNLSTQFTSNFVDSLLTGQDALKSFRDFAKSIVNQILTIFLQMEVVNRILAGIFPNAGISFGGILPEKSTPDSDPLLDMLGKNRFTGAFGGAGGGAMHVGQARLVGERGPELFIPHANGTLLNNMNTKNAMGGGQGVVINQSVNFATGVQATVRNEVLQLMPQIATVTKAAVSQSAERSLRYRGSLKNA
jgi:hypothetical protein